MDKKDRAAELRAELEKIEKEIEVEDQIEELKSLLHDLREEWLALRRNQPTETTRDYHREDEIENLQKRLDKAIGPRDSTLSKEDVEEAFQKGLRSKMKARYGKRCSGGQLSYCAPDPDGEILNDNLL